MLRVSFKLLQSRIKTSVKFFDSDRYERSLKVLEFTSVTALSDIFSYLPKKFLFYGNVGEKETPR